MESSHYVGLDFSQELTSLCVIDEQGAIIWRGKCTTDPDILTRTVRQHAPHLVRAGLETGLLSNFLTRALRARGVPIVCIDARHAKAALRVQINTPMMRMAWHRWCGLVGSARLRSRA